MEGEADKLTNTELEQPVKSQTEGTKKIAVAIDGPAGAGKSSISKAVADKLEYLYIDTGAMYRAVTLAALRRGIPCEDKGALEDLLLVTRLDMKRQGHGFAVYVDGVDVTCEIRDPKVTAQVSTVAAHRLVREYLVDMQRKLAAQGGVILDGRDIGSVVLPDAELKIYLTASVATRAKRRWLELKDTQPQLTLADIQHSVEERDYKDKHRQESPLVCVPEAIVIDSSNLTFEETVAAVVALIREKETR